MLGLETLPSGVDEALQLVGQFDECLIHGFARLGESQHQSLDDLTAALGGSPLARPLADAVAAVHRGEFVPRSFLVLASARVALLGAIHDALLAQARAVFGREAVANPERAARPAGGSSAALASVLQWLVELAIAGFRQLEETELAPFATTLQGIQLDPESTGLSALLTGFLAELSRSLPASRMPELPAFRWGDLWSAAVVRTQQLPAAVGFREAKGILTPLGLDVKSHDNFACILLYGLFDQGETRLVRVPFTHYKVGAIAGAETWDFFEPIAVPVLDAMENHKVLRVDKAELRDDGDLILKSPPKVGGAADPFGLVDRIRSMPDPPALARHPVHIAEVVHVRTDHGLRIAQERIPAGSVLTPKAIDAAVETFGLLRFDRGCWRIQPLCIRHPILGVIQGGEEFAEARRKRKHQSLEVLHERASRLLRKS